MVEPGLVAARAVTYAAMLAAAGLPIYLLTAGRRIRTGVGLRHAIAVFAALAIAASLWSTLASVAAMAATPLTALDPDMAFAVLRATPLGSVLAIRVAALMALAVTAWRGGPRTLLGALAALALATAAWTGHAGATEGGVGWLHRLADVVHLLAAAAWLGGMAVLLHSLIKSTDRDERLRRFTAFAQTGTVIVGLLLVTGIVNMLVIAGPRAWVAGLWTAVLCAKLALFAGMLGLAGLNRWILVPALRSGSGAVRILQLSLAAEIGLSLIILGLVALLGTLDPAG